MGYLGISGYPDDLSNSIFVCDVVSNLIHRNILKLEGGAFKAKRPPAEKTSEFFASKDNHFRPIALELGPDGALYLADMQREVIEHPDYIPSKLKKEMIYIHHSYHLLKPNNLNQPISRIQFIETLFRFIQL